MRSKNIFVQGMHCGSCEKLLDGEFRKVSGVKDVKMNREEDQAEIFYETQFDFEELKRAAEKYGYKVSENDTEIISAKKASWGDWLRSILLVIVLLILYRLFQNSGLVDRINLQNSNVSSGVSLLIGLVASVSSCLAVVGTVIIAFSEKYQSEGKNFYENAVRPNISFHIGRLATFFLLGGLLGLIGGEINISGNFISFYTIIIAIVMGWLGLNILGFLPSLSAAGISMPKSLTGNWEKLKHSEHKAAPFLLGGLTFFLPCGFTQSMQIFALASGSFWAGAMSLLMFSLGTVPVLFALGVGASWGKFRKIDILKKTAGILVLLFAVFTFRSALALKGVKTSVIGNGTNQEKSQSEQAGTAKKDSPAEISNEKEQIVRMSIASRGFEPSTLKIKKGIPVKWVITGDQVTACTNKIIIPSLNITKNIGSGENVINFVPSDAREIPFSCWMGMVRGKFIVE
jgi:uncharacterized protein